MSNDRVLKNTFEALNIPVPQIKQIIKDFHLEMSKGLKGRKSSLKMIPTYLDTPCGDEKGRFIALDVGGTNLRILELELKGKGRILTGREKRFTLEDRYTRGGREAFFDFIAGCLKEFSDETGMPSQGRLNLGFTFSFPIKQTGPASGILLGWTKDFSVKEVEGREVVGLLREALARKGLGNIKITALLNDTVATLVARSYADKDCDIGLILGTGTNACYRERVSQIQKLRSHRLHRQHMIINIEWGNFDKIELSPFDVQLDAASSNPGEQILEKIVSGMYLGRITELIIRDLTARKILFRNTGQSSLSAGMNFKTEYMPQIERDSSRRLLRTAGILKEVGIKSCTIEDRVIVKKICGAVSRRGARVSAAALSAVIIKIDSAFCRKHTVAIDGSLYEKHRGYSRIMKSALKEIFGRKSGNIRLALTKDGSGKGAAITAAAVLNGKGQV